MGTIIFKCSCCDMVLFGDKDRNFVSAHLIPKGKDSVKFVDKYYICDNCKEYDKQKYMEV